MVIHISHGSKSISNKAFADTISDKNSPLDWPKSHVNRATAIRERISIETALAVDIAVFVQRWALANNHPMHQPSRRHKITLVIYTDIILFSCLLSPSPPPLELQVC
jgi:predicted RNase H-related nuclease YkuK (DUF458 family)